MPSKQEEGAGEGAGDPPAGELGVLLGAVDGLPVGVLLGPPVGELDEPPPEVGLAGELLPGRAEGLADALLPGCVDCELDVPGVADPPGLVVPPAEPDEWDARDAVGDGVCPLPAPCVEEPAGCLAAGGLLNTPEASSATRPALATAAAPIAIAPGRRRDRSG
jgi:hypothetical protein